MPRGGPRHRRWPVRGLTTSSGYIAAEVAVLAIGHRARDTYDMLLRRGVPIEPSPFSSACESNSRKRRSIALVTEHPRPPRPWGSRLQSSVRTPNRDLFTFCMSAGGYVMPSVSEPGYSHQRHEREPP